MHASATKLMIMSVVPERPYSADSATRALREFQKDIDFHKSTLHGDAIKRRNTIRDRKQRTKRTASIEGIEERGEFEEEDPKRGDAAKSGLSMAKFGSSATNPFTQSNMNIMKNKMDANLDDALSLTAIECKYLVSVFKNRSVQAHEIKEAKFDGIYSKARATLKIQMNKLLLKKQF